MVIRLAQPLFADLAHMLFQLLALPVYPDVLRVAQSNRYR